MNIKIDVIVKAPEIVSAINNLIGVIPMGVLNTDDSNEANQIEEAKESKTTKGKSSKDKSKKEEITLETVRGKLASLSQSGKQKEVKALIKKFGVSKLSEISKDKYPELLEEAKEI